MALQYAYDLFIVDIIIPYINGLDLCRLLKQRNPDVPVLMLTALGTTEDKLQGFDAGANDYLVKPFEFRELLARVRVLLKTRGMSHDTSNSLFVADLELDLDKKVARRGGLTIELTAKEFLLLQYFMRNNGRVLSRNDIAENVWDMNYDFSTNVVDVYVNFLRKKIDKGHERKLINTRIGLGYIFGDI
jgi:two-component system copper resistance phosphate regulon response regulator CusR